MTQRPRSGKKLLLGSLTLYTLIVASPLACLLHSAAPQSHPYLILLGILMTGIPWLALRGSYAARGIAGVITLIGALMAAHISCTVIDPRMRFHGQIALLFFPALCFLTHIFLINRQVQAYIGIIRRAKGWPDSPWRLDLPLPGYDGLGQRL